ncbi:MAG: hypothetical protein M3461_22070 [Pseudomonadota bacterium]|nr:hypothetical protein [Pseudomonadota bacterium]
MNNDTDSPTGLPIITSAIITGSSVHCHGEESEVDRGFQQPQQPALQLLVANARPAQIGRRTDQGVIWSRTLQTR